MRTSRDRTDEFLSLVGRSAQASRLAQRDNIVNALRANLPAAQVHRVVLHEIALAQASAANVQAAQHWCEAERIFVQRHAVEQAPEKKALALTGIHRQLEYVSTQYEAVLRMAASQSATIGSIERNIDSIHTRIDASHRELEDAAPRRYRTWRWHRELCPGTLSGRLQCAFVLLMALNVLFVYTVLL